MIAYKGEHGWDNERTSNSYVERRGLGKASPQSIERRGHAIWTQASTVDINASWNDRYEREIREIVEHLMKRLFVSFGIHVEHKGTNDKG